MQNNTEHDKGTPHTFTGFDKTLSNQHQHPHHLQKHTCSRSENHTSSLPSVKLGLKHEFYDAITYTKPSRQHQATRMSNNVTWLLREQQLENVIKTRRSYVNFEKCKYSKPPTHWALQFRIVQVEGVFMHPNPNKLSGYVTVPICLRDVLPIMRFLDKTREMKSQPDCSMKISTWLLHNQLDVIVNRRHLRYDFIEQIFLLILLGYSREDIEEYKIQIPTSMTLLQNTTSNIANPYVDSNPRCPSKGV